MQQNKQLFVNSISVDFFSEDEPMPLILQVNDLGDLQSLQGHGSKVFKLPLTQKNREIFGFPDDITITTNIPYTQLPAKYLEDGIEIVANGLAEVQSVQDNYVNVMLLFGNIDLLDKLGGQIYDMGDSTSIWSGYGTNKVWDQYSMPKPNQLSDLSNCIWDVPHAAYSQQKTDGWIWPIVNYGGINQTDFSQHINVRNQRPAFFLHTAIELLIQSTGYTIDKDKSCLYNDPVFANLYNRLLIQFDNSSFEHGTDWQNTPDNLGATYSKGLDQIVNNPRVDIVTSPDIHINGYPFEGVISFGPSDHYTATTNVNFTATVHFNLYMRGYYTGTPSEVIIKYTVVDTDGSFIDFASTSFTLDANYHRLGGSGGSVYGEETFLNQKVSQDFQLVAGQKLYVRYHINHINLISVDPASTYFIFRKDATFSIVTNEQLVLWQQPIQCERILPNVSQLDFLKDTLQRFGLLLISDPNSGKIIFTSFKTIVGNKPLARDWSDKCKDMGRQNTFQLGNYSQVNWLRYQQDDSIPLTYMRKYFADDSISINDKTLNPTEPVKDLFTSIFAPSLNTPYIGGSIAQISDPTSTDFFSVGGQPRLLIDQKINLLNAGPGGSSITVTFSDNDAGFETATIPINDVISVPYFYKPDAPDLGDGAPRHLSWSDKGGLANQTLPGLKSTYYPELETILTRTKKVTRYFYLTPADIVDFDFTIPVYLRQDGAYYYVSKIDSWVKGHPCKVDLIKIG